MTMPSGRGAPISKYDKYMGEVEHIKVCSSQGWPALDRRLLEENMKHLNFVKCPHTYSFHFTDKCSYYVVIFSVRGMKYHVCCRISKTRTDPEYYVNGTRLGSGKRDKYVVESIDSILRRVLYAVSRQINTRI